MWTSRCVSTPPVMCGAIVVIVIPSSIDGWVAPHRKDDGQDSDGPVRQAPMRSLRPTDGCRECPGRADGSSSGQSERTSAGFRWSQTRLGHSLATLVGQEETVNVQRDPRCRVGATVWHLRDASGAPGRTRTCDTRFRNRAEKVHLSESSPLNWPLWEWPSAQSVQYTRMSLRRFPRDSRPVHPRSAFDAVAQ